MNAGFTTALGPVWMRLQSEFVEQLGGEEIYCAVARQVHVPGPQLHQVHTPGAEVQQVKS